MSILRKSVISTFKFRSFCCGTRHLNNVKFLSNNYVREWKMVKQFFSASAGKSDKGKEIDDESSNSSFEYMLNFRRNQAERSIIVQVHSEQSCVELYEYCKQYGLVEGMHHYTVSGSQHFVLVEFSKQQDVLNVLENSGHLNPCQVVPVHSPFLWFRAKGKRKMSKSVGQNNSAKIPLVQENGNTSPTLTELKEYMLSVETLSDQIVLLYNATCLQDLGTRLRFMTALQLESAVKGMFPLARALPFGSSVTGFGKTGCDLDVVLEFEVDKPLDGSRRLIFQAKSSLSNERIQIQRHMETIGDLLQLFLPGCSNVKRILQARVPIIKFRHDLTAVDCDLSLSNISGVYMGELLYIFGELDNRVRPLVFAVRLWAKEVGVTNPTPGRWITNFSLILLVIFFLQNHVRILPTLVLLKSLAGSEDERITAEGVNCTFARNISKIKQHIANKTTNTDNLETLLVKFFEFYSKFDFSSRAISILDGTMFPKPEHSALYIVNPLETTLNVTKNVSHEEADRFKVECRNAAWTLQSTKESNTKKSVNSAEPWGLVTILESANFTAVGKSYFYSSSASRNINRLMEVKDLFGTDNNDWDTYTPLKKRSHSDVNMIKPEPLTQSKTVKNSENSVSRTAVLSKSKRRR